MLARPGRDAETVRRALAEFPAAELGLESVRARMAELSEDELGFSRHHYSPGHFTASAFVVDPNEASLLLIHHRKLGLWLQPGGHVEPEDETLLEAGLREVREETGVVAVEVLAAIFDLDIHSIPAFGETPEHLHYDVRCLLRAKTTALRVTEEVRAASWFPLELVADGGALSGGVGTDESVRRAARRLLRGR